jgi:hypothetical protein
VSAIDYLIRTHGQEALVKLIRSYADGVSDDAAFNAALGVDVAGFEEGWLGDLGVDEPVPYGPRAAPPGPLPPGWAAAPAASGNPGSSGKPAPTIRTTPSPSSDISGPITVVVLAVLAVLLAVGLFVVARGLSRGQPLLAPLDAAPGSDVDDLREPDDGTDDPHRGPETQPRGEDLDR